MATLTRFVPLFRARLQLWAARAEAARRGQAATAIQSHVRRWLAQRRLAAAIRGITRLQVWPG